MTKEELLNYRKRVQEYMTSREYFAGLFRDGVISEKEFNKINNWLLKKYHLSKRTIFNFFLKNRGFICHIFLYKV